jgi:putative transposase
VTTFGISERRACELLGVWRSSCRYRKKPDRNQDLRQELTAFARERPRFGYRRLHVLLAREGRQINHKRLFRVYWKAGLEREANSAQEVGAGRRQPTDGSQ